MRKIAITHPGKHGDILYLSSCMKALSRLHDCQIDFYTSAHAKTLDRLYEYQPYIDKFFSCGEREDWFGGWGIQHKVHNWDMSSFFDQSQYEAVYQMGFQKYPDCAIDKFYAKELGINEDLSMVGVFEYPRLVDLGCRELVDIDYIVIAPRGDKDFYKTYMGIMDKVPMSIVQIGGHGEYFEHKKAIDYTGVDWLETVSILSNAKVFIGPLSSQTGLAHNFNYPKAVIYHPGYGAGIAQRPITPTTVHFLQEQGGLGPVDQILQAVGIAK